MFSNDIVRSVRTTVRAEKVHCYNIDNGVITRENQTALEHEYLEYLIQDVPLRREDNAKVFSFLSKYAFRILFCKDVYFKKEQEFRIVLPDEKIENGKIYPINLTIEYQVYDLMSIFDR